MKIGPYIRRLFLFQFIFVFAYFRYTTFDKSLEDFTKRIKYYSKGVPYLQTAIMTLDMCQNGIRRLFDFFLKLSAFSAILAVLGYKVFQTITAYFLLIIAIIYVNPSSAIEKNMRKYPGRGYKNYIPSQEFMVLFSLAAGMIAYAFNFNRKRSTGN